MGHYKSRRKIYFEYQIPSELLIISLEAFLAISVALLVAFSIIDVIPTLSAPFITPSKKVFQPRPIITKNSMATTINTRIPIANTTSIIPLTITKGIYLHIVQKLESEYPILI
jgi:hypothetical protein